MRYIYLIIISLSCVLLFSCKTNTSSVLTFEQKFQHDQIMEGIDKDSLIKGRALAKTECASCHRFYFPREYSPEQWIKIIRKKARRLSLGKKQMADINLYFQIESRSTR